MRSLTKVVNGTTFICYYNGDYSEDVIATSSRDNFSSEHHIPYAIMEELVGQKLMDEEISSLQEMSGRDFLHATYAITNTDTE